MKRLIALVVSGVALAACASPTEPATTAAPKIEGARQALTGATRAQTGQVNVRLSSN